MLNATHHINLQPAKILVYISQDSMEIHFLVAAILTPSNNFQIFSFAGASQAEVRSDRKSRKYYFQFRREHFSMDIFSFNKDIILDNDLLS